MVVQHNIPAMNANRYFGINNSGLSKSLEKLSSGYAINRAGDNAAGLAVSEKMRSQIAGLTQGVKNAQDGISMIQTYEGALTETDSILQRMKTLADQAANGTYQDDVDRDAIQLEFDQLNDELNQIADTDFNGVIVLNGGQMADGTKAVDGKFDYENGTRQPKTLSAADVNVVDYQEFDDVDTTAGVTKADTVWQTIGGWVRNDSDTSNNGPDSVDVTLKYDSASNEWAVTGANNGADYTKIKVNMTDNGGFELTDGTNTIANIVLDGTKLMNGDSMTVTLNNPLAGVAVPTNIGVAADGIDTTGFTEGTIAGAVKAQDANLTTTIDAGLDASKMTDDVNQILNALQGATVTAKYGKLETAATDMSITMDGQTASSTAATMTLSTGAHVFFDTSTAGEITIYAGDDNSGTAIAKIAMTAQGQDDNANSAGTITYKLGVDYNNYDTSKKPTVEVKDVNGNAVSKANAFEQANAPLTYTDHIILQSGARTKDAVDFTFKYSSGGLGNLKANMNCSSREDGLGTAGLKLTDQKSANYAIDRIDNAINKVSMVRATFGAVQNRLEHKIDNMNVTKENITSAESRIRDTNMAEEMTNFTKNQILSQASQAMLAQANQLPQGVLQLLG